MKKVLYTLMFLSVFPLGGCLSLGTGRQTASFTNRDGQTSHIETFDGALLGLTIDRQPPDISRAMLADATARTMLSDAEMRRTLELQLQQSSPAKPQDQPEKATSTLLAINDADSKQPFMIVNPESKAKVKIQAGEFQKFELPKDVNQITLCFENEGCKDSPLSKSDVSYEYKGVKADYLVRFKGVFAAKGGGR